MPSGSLWVLRLRFAKRSIPSSEVWLLYVSAFREAVDVQDRHQQYPPLRLANFSTQTAIGNGLDVVDQIGGSGQVVEQ